MLAINISFFPQEFRKYVSLLRLLLLIPLLPPPYYFLSYYFLLFSLLSTTSLLTTSSFPPYSLLYKEKAPASLVKTGRQGPFLRVLRGIRAAEWPEKGGLRRGV